MRTLLIAEDQPLMREGLKRILAEIFFRAEFGEATTTAEMLERLREKRWDVLLLNLHLIGRTGWKLLEQIKHEHPSVAILLLSLQGDDQLAIRALRCGVSGYVTKQTTPSELVRAVSKVGSGGRYLAEDALESLATSIPKTKATLHERLSNRELEVMSLLIAGKTLKEIAAELSVSVKTISTFHTRIREKLKVHTDVELVHYALEHNLTSTVTTPAPAAASSKIVQAVAYPV